MTPGFRRPAVMLVNGRGDYLLNLPTLRALTHIFQGNLVFVTKRGVVPLFYRDLSFAEVIEVETSPGAPGPEFDAHALARALANCDLFLSLNPWRTGSLDRLLELLGEIPSIGFSSIFAYALPLDFTKHTADLAFDVVRCLSDTAMIEQYAAPPRFAPAYEQLARGIRDVVPAGARVVCVHNDTKPEKQWSDDRFAALIEWLLDADPDVYVFDLGLNPIGQGALEREPRVIPCNELVLPAAFALTGLADAFIGVDSCFLHAADLYGVPGVGLFGPTDVHEFGFRFGPHRHVAAARMEDITEADVRHAVESMIPMRMSVR